MSEHPTNKAGPTKSVGPKGGNGFPSGCNKANIFGRAPASRSFRATQNAKVAAHADAPPNTRAPHSTAIANDLRNEILSIPLFDTACYPAGMSAMASTREIPVLAKTGLEPPFGFWTEPRRRS